jgi:hypothetical protein
LDVIIPPDTDFARSEASRVRRLSSEGEYSAFFGSPEDVLLHKLIYYRLSGGVSEKHLRDIAGIMKLQGSKLDREYVSQWDDKVGVAAEWNMVQQRVDPFAADQ